MENGKWKTVTICAVLALIAAATYLPMLGYPLVYDDLPVIARNPVITEPGGWSRVLTEPWWPRTESLDPLYRPLTTLTFKLNHALFGPDPLSFRCVNLGLHALVTVFVAALAARLWAGPTPHSAPLDKLSDRFDKPRDRLVSPSNHRAPHAIVAGLLFAVHPLHAEALGLVVGRAELLATLFVCWLLFAHLKRAADRSVRKSQFAIRNSLLFLAALCSKEHAVIAWPMILLIDIWSGPRGAGRAAWREHLNRALVSHHFGMIVVLTLFLLARWLIFGGRTTLPAELVNVYANPLRGAEVSTYAATGFALLWLMLSQWFAGTPLSPIWSVGGFNLPSDLINGPIVAGAVVAAALVTVLIVGPRRLGRLWLLAALFALSVLLPCHFIPAANWLYAERWAYLPSVFLAVALAGVARWSPRVSVAGAVAVAALLAPVTVSYQRCWRDQETLFRSTVERHPSSYHGLLGLLSVLERTGRMAEAPPYAARMVTRFPNSERAWYFQALAAGAVEDWESAESALRRWAPLRPLEPVPARIQQLMDALQQRGRGTDIEL